MLSGRGLNKTEKTRSLGLKLGLSTHPSQSQLLNGQGDW